jgi:hypothetical protein
VELIVAEEATRTEIRGWATAEAVGKAKIQFVAEQVLVKN